MRLTRGRPSPLVVELASEADGFVEFAFEVVPLFCFFEITESGIPGIGVAPLVTGFPESDGSELAGTALSPFARALFTAFGSGIPGVEFPDGLIGSVVIPGGKLFWST